VTIREVDQIVRATECVQIGAFRCPVGHPSFADSGPIRNHCIVFPRTPVVIRHRDRQPFPADPTLATMYNRGQEYGRVAISPAGDQCDWYAIAPGLLRDALATYDPRAAHDERPIRFAFAPVDAGTYLKQRCLFNEVGREPGLDSLHIDEAVIELLDRVLASAYRRRPERDMPAQSAAARLARDVRELLGRRFAEPLSLSDISRAVGASVFHLCRSFRRATGTTIHEHRNQLRLRSALARLEDADCDLSQLALELGYSSHSHFTASFRTAFGIPPSLVRRRPCATS
jgi:AraC-like DNA-binding protein